MLNPFDPMPTIKAILGLPIHQAVIDALLLAVLDDFEAPQCESPQHASNPAKHSGAAEFFVITPCHHRDGYLCAAITSWLKVNSNAVCRCGQSFAPSDLTFIPIAGNQ